MKLSIKPEVARLNSLVEELDGATDFAFDRVTDIPALAKLAEAWPGSRIGLGDELRAAHLSIAMHKAFRHWLPIWGPF